ncbi:hypothetical protein B0I35DRAFT_476514 [Stachybotrys elegans]|uniref:Uncharacterized protein n=1 Tax=Stachybotrys elegans TaxID=80388 RepID=A0A8K0WTX6_9HYPO|nr:hypothetical protein B0I35DRAFT_476514 [Stachybotrys elegans]
MAENAVLVPMGVQTFVVTEDFLQSNYRIAPLIQPDYSSLRAEGLLAHDVMEQLQLSRHRLLAKHNTRFVNVATGEVRKERVGVYLSWTIPKTYRQGITATAKAAVDHSAAKLKAGYMYDTKTTTASSDGTPEVAATDVKFRNIPTRYLIIRVAHSRNSSKPSSEIFVLESDRIRNINEAELNNLDVENITCPFINPDLSAEQQAEAFLGLKKTLRDYTPEPNAARRVPLTIVESGNDLFADFQPHNNSVFSLHDDLGLGTSSEIKDATLDYLVVGFHHRPEDEPFCVAESVREADRPSYGELLDACAMDLDGSSFVWGSRTRMRADWPNLKADSASTRVICHGALKSVPFQRSGLNLEAKSPSVQLQDLVRKHHPVAIGTNILDALLAFLRVQYSDDPEGRSQTEQMLSKMVQLIVARDNIDAQEKAEDQISTNDWVPAPSGTVWSVSQSKQASSETGDGDKTSLALTAADVRALAKLNECEAAVSAMVRERQHLYRIIFYRWWNAMEVRGTALDASQQGHKNAIAALLDKVKELNSAIEAATKEKVEALNKLPSTLALEAVSAPPFGVHQDPTILFAGVPSGWPAGFADKVKVRLAYQLVQIPDVQPLAQEINIPEWYDLIAKNFPDVAPFIRQVAWDSLVSHSTPVPRSPYLSEEGFGEGQGWFPLFIEWEVEYHQVDWRFWRFDQDPDGSWRYHITGGRPLADLMDPNASWWRKLSGRTPIMPQASSALISRIRQLFSRAQQQVADEKADADSLVKQIAEIGYFSAPLAGLRDHLMTTIRGAHVRPHADDDLARELGLSESDLGHLVAASERAPYGRLAQVEGHDPRRCASFYPVTHGQFLFTKLHIVDKFGQIVSCVEPATFDAPRTALYPCVSPHLSCEPIPKGWKADDTSPWPNTAYQADEKPGPCQFFQVAPRINQDARLNAEFVVEAQDEPGSEPYYRPVTPFENPIWGWIIVSNLDKSLQVFNTNGRFIREFCLDEDSKKVTTPSPPPEVHRAATLGAETGSGAQGRLSSLLRNLLSYPYALGMLTMLETAYQATSSNTADHPDFLPAAFGRAFCLADFGCSIELAWPPLQNTCTQHEEESMYGPSDLTDYEFPIGLGNAGAGFDGLAGYFDTLGDPEIKDIYSDFGDARDPDTDVPGPYANPTIKRQGPSLMLQCYHPAAAVAATSTNKTVAGYASGHREALQLRSVILDPMRPLHIYTGGLLPMKDVILPHWAVGSAMKEMHAFFSAGPLLVPHLPPPNDMRINVIAEGGNTTGQTKEPGVQVPVSGLDDWTWWQAREVSGGGGSGTTDNARGWSSYPAQGVDGNLDLTPSANHSEFVEGFLMMNKNLKEEAAGGV